jgi:FHS family L-fucose permease-like MFS transporter
MTAVVGGAVIPALIGWVADKAGIAHSFVIPAFCYLFIAYYGLVGSKPTRTVVS